MDVIPFDQWGEFRIVKADVDMRDAEHFVDDVGKAKVNVILARGDDAGGSTGDTEFVKRFDVGGIAHFGITGEGFAEAVERKRLFGVDVIAFPGVGALLVGKDEVPSCLSKT